MTDPKDDLFHLAKSMSVREAGYFNTWLNRAKTTLSNAYLKMLEIIRKQEAYNEAALLKTIKNRKISSNLSYHKNILSGYITDCLLEYNAESLSYYKVFHYLKAAQLLFDRRLYPQVLTTLGKACKEANRYEMHLLLLEICETERKAIKRMTPPDLKTLLDNNSLKIDSCWRKIENEKQYTALNDKVFIWYKELHHLKTPAIPDELNMIMQDTLLINETTALTFDAKLKYHYIHALYAQLTKDYPAGLLHREAALRVWEAYPHMQEELSVRYREDLSALLSMMHECKVKEGFEELMKRIENIKSPCNTEEDGGVLLETYYISQLFLLNNNKWKDALELVPKIGYCLEKHEKTIEQSRLFNFWHNNAITCFLCTEYKASLTWVNKLRAVNRNNSIRIDLRDFACILEMILHYQSGDYDRVTYLLRNIKDRLKKNYKMYDLEEILLHFMTRLLRHKADEIKTKETFKHLLFKLRELSRQPGKQNLLGLDELIIWATEKAA